jgi:hypothetical protein
MAQTRFLRSVIKLTIKERIAALFFGRLAVTATVYPDRLEDITIGIFPGDGNDADQWIKTGDIAS